MECDEVGLALLVGLIRAGWGAGQGLGVLLWCKGCAMGWFRLRFVLRLSIACMG